MTAYKNDTSRLTWLLAALAAQRDKLANLLCRLTGLGTPGAMNPSIFGKFLRLLEQVAAEREKEMRILDRIENVEKLHRYRREHHQLQDAPAPQNPDDEEPDDEAAPEPARKGLLW